MRNLAFIFILLFGFQGAYAAKSCNSSSLACRLKNSKSDFRCVPRPEGEICVFSKIDDVKFKYSQPVAFLIPKNLKRPTGILLYLHGHRGVCESTSLGAVEIADKFQLFQQMKEAEVERSVMVLPLSLSKCTTYEMELLPQISNFSSWVTDQIEVTDETPWILAGHSGAGKIMAMGLGQNPDFAKKIRAAILLDATYGIPGQIENWNNAVSANPGMKILSTFVEGGDTEAGNQLLMSSLNGGHFESGPSSSPDHCQVPNFDFKRLLKRALKK